MITKFAGTLLQEHQNRVLEKLRNPDLHGIFAYHSTGSGKTWTALRALQEAHERTGKRGLFIVPASLVENAKVVPSQFESEFVDSNTGFLKNRHRLGKELAPYGDIYDSPADSSAFLSAREKIIHVPMGDKQHNLYQFPENKLSIHLRSAVRNNLPMTAKDTAALNSFATGVRQASLSTLHHDVTAKPEDSPKLLMAANRMAEAAKAPGFRGVAYSNYLDVGIKPYAELLWARGSEPLIFTGSMSARQKKELIDSYNSTDPAAHVLLFSSSGGEGLDLKGTRRLRILEPNFNSAKLDQVEVRGVRYGSHAHLPEDERNLLIEQFHSMHPKRWYNRLFGTTPATAIDY